MTQPSLVEWLVNLSFIFGCSRRSPDLKTAVYFLKTLLVNAELS